MSNKVTIWTIFVFPCASELFQSNPFNPQNFVLCGIWTMALACCTAVFASNIIFGTLFWPTSQQEKV